MGLQRHERNRKPGGGEEKTETQASEEVKLNPSKKDKWERIWRATQGER